MLDLSELRASDIALAGGKGGNLGEMIEEGLPVPPGLLSTVAFDFFIEKSGIGEHVLRELRGLDLKSTTRLDGTSSKIRDLFEISDIPRELEKVIVTEYTKMKTVDGNPAMVAVRSLSATGTAKLHTSLPTCTRFLPPKAKSK